MQPQHTHAACPAAGHSFALGMEQEQKPPEQSLVPLCVPAGFGLPWGTEGVCIAGWGQGLDTATGRNAKRQGFGLTHCQGQCFPSTASGVAGMAPLGESRGEESAEPAGPGPEWGIWVAATPEPGMSPDCSSQVPVSHRQTCCVCRHILSTAVSSLSLWMKALWGRR